jgi:tetratricopeptide (TPR) repeat protein
MQGAGIKQDERIYGATLLDVTPTLLTLFGLPVGEDMDGRVLVQAFEQPPQIKHISSWEAEAGECGMHPEDVRVDPVAAQAVIERFVALGYMEAPSEDQAKEAEMAVREQQYNLARTYLDGRRFREALPILKELVKKWPDQVRFSQHLAQCLIALLRPREAKVILERLIAYPPIPARKEEGERRPEAVAPAGLEQTNRMGSAGEDAENTGDHPWVDLLMGIIQFEDGNMDEALASLKRAEQFDPYLPDLHLRIGNVYLRQKRTDDAQRAFERALEIDGDSPEAYLGLATTHLRKRCNEQAVECALHAVGLQHFLPMGHFHLGVGLARLGHRDRAALAFETSLTMLPGLVAAHRWLATLYQLPGGDPGKSAQHRSIYLQMRRRQRMQA